jgi:malate dehydrogenase (oxaloacetate-decarboxylating)(NADP+)
MASPPQWAALSPTVTTETNTVILSHMCPTQRKSISHPSAKESNTASSAHFDTSLPIPVRKYLQTYGLTPPRVESYEVQKKRCQPQRYMEENRI